MLHYGVTTVTWVMAFLGVASFTGRVVTAVQERRNAEKRRKADRERIIAQQDRNIEERRQERPIAQQRRDAAETKDR
jgi:Flp pilus assembly protein TadB